MKKNSILGFLLFFSLLTIGYGESDIDFLVKTSISDDSTYRQEIEDISTFQEVTFELIALGNSSPRDLQIIFPLGFEYANHDFSESDCSIISESTSNSHIIFSFKGDSGDCVFESVFTYKVPASAGNYKVDILEGNTLKNHVKIGVIAENTIIKAVSLDENKDGYIDGYKLTFAKPIGSNDVSGLTVEGKPVTYYDTNSQIISFGDGIFHTGELPQILSSGVIFGNVKQLLDESIREEDGAASVLLKANNTSKPANSQLTSLQLGKELANQEITLTFSEKLKKFTASLQDKNQENTGGNFSHSGSEATFIPSEKLYSDQNPHIFSFTGTDWSDNILKQDIEILVEKNVCDAVSNGVLLDKYNYPTCSFNCNSGYEKSGKSCIPKSGGGGGGTPSTCSRDIHLECKIYQGKYIWQRKSGQSCQGGDLLKECSIDDTKGEDNSQGDSSGGGDDTTKEDMKYDLEEIYGKLLETTHKGLHKTITQTKNQMNYLYLDYFVNITQYYDEYQELLKNYQNLFVNIQKYLDTKDKNTLLLAYNNYQNFSKLHQKYQDLYKVYILPEKNKNQIIYKTQIPVLKKPLDVIESILLKKYNTLHTTKTISLNQYTQAIKDYNHFVFYISAYRKDKNSYAKTQAKSYLKKVLDIYNLKVKKSPKPTIPTSPVVPEYKVQDIYPLNQDMKLGDYNENIKNLQNILLHFGYYPFPEITGYFGEGTREYLEKFTQDMFGEKYSEVKGELREKIGNLKY